MIRAGADLVRESPEVELVFLGGEAPGLAIDRIPGARFCPMPPAGVRGDVPGTPAEEGEGALPPPAATDRIAGGISVAALDEGIRMALAGEVAGLVTGPVSKPALHAAGARFPGQTEFLQDRTGAEEVGMLMASPSSRLGVPLRILLLTTHLALRDVPDALTGARVRGQLRLLDAALSRGWGIARPRLALCALNPHASDGGLFGDEEARVLAPVVAELRSEGIEVDGPFPADTVFQRVLRGEADAVAVPTHDTGMAVFKTLAFGTGVNVTLGLPFPRTSPDHGTAFDLAGRGQADSGSALEALRLAVQLARAEVGRRPGPPARAETDDVPPLTPS